MAISLKSNIGGTGTFSNEGIACINIGATGIITFPISGTTLLDTIYTGTLTGSTGIINIGSGQLYKDSSGNFGINTTSPSSKLHVVGGAITSNNFVTTAGILNTTDYSSTVPTTKSVNISTRQEIKKSSQGYGCIWNQSLDTYVIRGTTYQSYGYTWNQSLDTYVQFITN